MRDRGLLITALVLVATGLIGMTLQESAGGWGMQGPMMGPMMGWWGSGYANDPGRPPVAGAVTLEVVATEFAFEPDELAIAADESFNLSLTNNGTVLHDLTIPELGVRLVARSGEAATVGLRAARAGRYRFSCTVAGHAEAGMVGVLVADG